MNNLIISLNNELINCFDNLKLNNDNELFIKDVASLLYFYFKNSLLNGINITRKKLKLDKLIDIKEIQLINDKISIINFNSDDLLEDIVKQMMFLYRYGQLIEFKNNNINEVLMITNNNSCEYCKLLSKQKQDVDYLIKHLTLNCYDCFIKYDIINNINLSILNKIKFSNKDLLTNYNFVLVNAIDEIPNINLFFKEDELEIIRNNFVSIQIDNNIYINNEYENIDYLLIKYSIKDKIKINQWWIDKFNKSTYFINYVSRKNPEQYLLENVVLYIINPNELKLIDIENYNKIKDEIFNGIEVF